MSMMDFMFKYGIWIVAAIILVIFVFSMMSVSSKCEREVEELERQRMIELSKKKDEESGGFNG